MVVVFILFDSFRYWLGSVRAAFVVLALLITGILVAPVTKVKAAGDMNWLVPGLRVWYRGVSASSGDGGGASAISTERVFTVKELGPEGATVHVLVSAEYYSQVISDRDELVPRPYEEGEFWISPQRLAGLRVGDVITWVDREYQVSDRGVYGLEDFVQKYMVDATPALSAIFAAGGGRRDVVALTGAMQGRAVYTFVFDAQTGLLLATNARDAYQEGTTLSLEVIAEINYDFQARRAFPEPEGPHPDYMMEYVFTDFYSGVLVDMRVIVAGRYRDNIMFATYIFVGRGDSSAYDATVIMWSSGGEVYGRVTTGHQGVPLVTTGLSENPTKVGDHLPFYIDGDVGADAITILNITMVNTGGHTFTAQGTAPFYFQSITFDDEGYATQVALYLSELGTVVQLTTNNPGFQAQRQVYAERLGPAVPQPPPNTSTTTATTQPITTSSTTTATTQPHTTTTATTQAQTTTSTTTPTTATETATPLPPAGGAGLPSALLGVVAGAAVGVAVVALLFRRRV